MTEETRESIWDDRRLFSVPKDGDEGDPRPIVRMLVEEVPMFAHLLAGEAVIMTVLRNFEKVKQGRYIYGTLATPIATGPMRDMFTWLLAVVTDGVTPDYILTLDTEFWLSATPMQQEALVFHELMHAIHERSKDGELKFTEAGRPVFGIQGHDLEEFNAVVERYGAWLPDIAKFGDALAIGVAKRRNG